MASFDSRDRAQASRRDGAVDSTTAPAVGHATLTEQLFAQDQQASAWEPIWEPIEEDVEQRPQRI